jgi:hypothetical protein
MPERAGGQILEPRQKSSGRSQTPRDFRSALRIVPDVPAIDRLGLGFPGAMRKHRVMNASAGNSKSSRGFECIGVFVAIQTSRRHFPAPISNLH